MFYEQPQRSFSIDGITLAALALITIVAFSVVIGRDRSSSPDLTFLEGTNSGAADPLSKANQDDAPPVPVGPPNIASPYDNYTLTQGPHGASYGHMAIDIAAGKGATIKSPINGVVTALRVDEYGNPTLVIENQFHQVTMLHGNYSVSIGDEVRQGQPVGTEGNHGYTLDMQGRRCIDRDCGYHTHLNIYDKIAGKNVNPLDVMR